MASMAPLAFSGAIMAPEVSSPVSGTIIFDTVIAAGTLMIEAVKMCPMTSGIVRLSKLA